MLKKSLIVKSLGRGWVNAGRWGKIFYYEKSGLIRPKISR